MPSETLNTQLMALFLDEVRERTSEMERSLLLLESAADPAGRQDAKTKLLRTAHSLKGAAGLVEMRSIEAVCHRIEDLVTALGKQQTHDRPVLELLLRANDAIAETGRMVEDGQDPDTGPVRQVLRELSTAISAPTSPAPDQPGGGQSGLARILSKYGKKEASPAGASLPARTEAPPFHAGAMAETLRIPAEKLDSFLHHSSEILLSRSRSRLHTEQVSSLRKTVSRMRQGSRRPLGRLAAGGSESATASDPAIIEELTVLDRGLRELGQNLAADERLLRRAAASLDSEIHRVRMQPFIQACQGLDRMVRDISLAHGKSVELAIEGGDIEIDRSILGGLQDPLRHLVRNAIDHGIENPAERRASGKPEKGKITVSAALVGDRVRVGVRDDGRGIDLSALRERADRNGIAEVENEQGLVRSIFLPGLSTSPAVTSLSGRGVGLDIVRTAVERLRGTADVSHTPGGGAVFTLTLPLTLATVRALVIVAGEQVFALDSSCVQRVIRISLNNLRPLNGRTVFLSEGRSMPVLSLTEWLGLRPGSGAGSDADSTAVIVGPEASQTLLLVEKVAGEQELVARSLGPRLAQVRSYSGGAILPDGRLALLLNAAVVSEAAMERRAGSPTPGKENQQTARRRVLVVDDSVAVRALEKLILERAGYEVVMAANGSEAWTRLQDHGADAVVADVDMPLMDGFALTRAIRESGEFKNLPVILVTARETPGDRERGLHLGADAYLTKSAFDQTQLLETIRQMV